MIVLDCIKRSLRMIGIIAENETPDAPQGVAALQSLNGMLAGWEHEGIRLGLPALELADTIPLPASHDDAICFNLAVALSAEYGAPLSPAIIEGATRTKAQLQAIYIFVPTMECDMALVRVGWRRRY